MEELVIIDYGVGNIKSLTIAFEKLGFKPKLTANAQEILVAKKVVLPGVGEASYAMQQLERSGLTQVVKQIKNPVLGICLGMQLLAQFLAEGNCRGLGLIPANVLPFQGKEKVPHMGWNTLEVIKGPLFNNIAEGDFMYFVHSYFGEVGPFTIAQTKYEQPFTAAWQNENYYGVQFHPEKSGKGGLQLLKNFMEL